LVTVGYGSRLVSGWLLAVVTLWLLLFVGLAGWLVVVAVGLFTLYTFTIWLGCWLAVTVIWLRLLAVARCSTVVGLPHTFVTFVVGLRCCCWLRWLIWLRALRLVTFSVG